MMKNRKWIFLISFVLIFSLVFTGCCKKKKVNPKNDKKSVSEIQKEDESVIEDKKIEVKKEDEADNDEILDKEEEKREDKNTDKKEIIQFEEKKVTKNEEKKTKKSKIESKKENEKTTSSAPKKEENKGSSVTISIEGPEDVGIILNSTDVSIEEGDTVLDVLQKITREKKIHLDFKGRKGSAYIKGIANIYEFDRGTESGWMYRVNGVFPSISVGAYKVKNGDKIEWLYTTQLGEEFK